MKNIIITIPLVLLVLGMSTQTVQAQFSSVKIARAEWVIDGTKTVSLKQGWEGTAVPGTSLGLKLFLDKTSLSQSGGEVVTFEFRWFRYGATKTYLTDSFLETIQKTPEGEPFIYSQRPNLRSGWWEIEVICYADNAPVAFNLKGKFQIKLN